MHRRIHSAVWVLVAIPVCLLGCFCLAESAENFRLEASPLDRYEALFDTLMGHYYAAADSVCEELNNQWPGHPAVAYARASVLYAQLCDFEDTTGTGRLENEVEIALAACKAWEESRPDSAEAEREYLAGAAYSVSGLTRHRQGKTLDGIRRLMASRSHFDRAIELDSTFYDAYVGRGAYRYAAASNMGFLRWLPGVPSKKQGWADLKLGLDNSKFSRFAALSSMVWIMLDEENWAVADSMVRAGLVRFPESRTFWMPKLALEKRTGQWRQARESALFLLNQYANLEFQNGYEVIGLFRSLMECSDMLGETNAAVSYAKAGLKVTATPYVLDRRKDTLKALRLRISKENGN